MKPRIAIPLPTAQDHAYNERNWPAFARAVTESGGEPVAWPLLQTDQSAAALARTCAGVVLPGSPADWTPARYGLPDAQGCAAADPAREAADLFLLDHAEHFGKPLLGVCFGMQSLNVWRGGTLVPDLLPLPVPHSSSSSVIAAHSVLVEPGTRLASLLDPAETAGNVADPGGRFALSVNSSHHQAAALLGKGLRAAAVCPQDGVIEAIEDDRAAWLLAVQWHPERTLDHSPTSRRLFEGLLAACQ